MPPVGPRRTRQLGRCASSAAIECVTLRGIPGAQAADVGVEPARLGQQLRDDRLRDGARVQVDRLLGDHGGVDDPLRALDPPDPEAGGERLGNGAEAQHPIAGDVGDRIAVVAQLAVGIVLDDQEIVLVGERGEPLTSRPREHDARRIVVVGDDIDELGPQSGLESFGELVDIETVGVDGHPDQIGLGGAEHLASTDIAGVADDDGIAGVEQDAADEVERLLGPGGDEHRVGAAGRDELPQPQLTLGQAVLEAITAREHDGRRLGDRGHGEPLGCRQPTRERQYVGSLRVTEQIADGGRLGGAGDGREFHRRTVENRPARCPAIRVS